jgi:4-hydroxybenzoate polyprenyltransferase
MNLQALLQLCRIPNVFTALADVLMGYCVTHPMSIQPGESLPPVVWLLLATSGLLYTAGMVLNDVFDREVDARERPERPIPSGRITLETATRLGYVLLIGGLVCGWAGLGFAGQWRTGIVTTLLTAAVWIYDRRLKGTVIAPLGMATCRFLNVLLGMSATTEPWHELHWIIAAGVGIYIAGVTWFARTEAEESSRLQLLLATLVMAGGIAILALSPRWDPLDRLPLSFMPQALELGHRWYWFWGLLATSILYRCSIAIVEPTPARVQAGVKHAILSLIVLDAAVALGACGILGAVMFLFLLVPAMTLGRWVYST